MELGRACFRYFSCLSGPRRGHSPTPVQTALLLLIEFAGNVLGFACYSRSPRRVVGGDSPLIRTSSGQTIPEEMFRCLSTAVVTD